MRRFLSWLLPAGAALAAAAGCGPSQGIDFQKIIATGKQKVYPSLVFVKPIRETFESGERQREEVFGSGVIISADGYVVTNHHVAEKAIEINCVLGDREQVPATTVGLDPETDLALLKLKLPPNHPPLTAAQFADSDKLEAGQFVMAMGAPFGFTRSISLGIISNTKRYIGFTTHYTYNLWIQTDAAINPGNSGGPLVDTRGQVVGINTLGASFAEGIGFAIPSNVASGVISRLKASAEKTDPKKWPVKVDRAYTGLQLQALNDFNTNTFTDSSRGVLVQSVDKDSPAAEAGLRDGDILLAVSVNGGAPRCIDGAYVEDLPAIRVGLADLPVDRPASLLIARKTSTSEPASQPATGPAARQADIKSVSPTLTPSQIGDRVVVRIEVTPRLRGRFEGEDYECRQWNMTVKEITKFSNPTLHFLQPSGGVFIRGVRGEGNAADAELRPNDIILKIGARNVKTIADVRKAYEELVSDKKDKSDKEKKVLITIKRGGFLDWKTLNWQKDYLQED